MQTQNTNSGSVAGGILLIAGCCIGAGMLGLPVLSAIAGFEPSVILFFISWIFMVRQACCCWKSTCGLKMKSASFPWQTAHWACWENRRLGRIFIPVLCPNGGLYFRDWRAAFRFQQELTGIRMPPWIGSLLVIASYWLHGLLAPRPLIGSTVCSWRD